MRKKPDPREEILAAARAEIAARRVTVDGSVHPFFSFQPNNEDQIAFMRSVAKTQVASGANRSGKTLCGDQKVIIAIRGYDPQGIVPEFPVVSDIPFRVWNIVPPEFTREALRDLIARIPPDMKYKAYWGKGDERVEFAPTERRPKGSVLTIKSYGQSIDQFQREAVHVVRCDEEMPEYIWVEINTRLASTKGWLWITLTLKSGLVWLWKRLRDFSQDYKNLLEGDFAWFQFRASKNKAVDFEEIKFRARESGLCEDDDMWAIRVEGDPRLLHGSHFFKSEILKAHWEKYSKPPQWEMLTNEDDHPFFVPWKEKKSGWRVWEKPEFGITYAIGADVGKGLEKDYSVATVLNCATGRIAAIFSDNVLKPWEYARELLAAGRYYNDAVLAPEVNIEEGALLHPLRQFGYPHIYIRHSFGGKMKDLQSSLGWFTDSRSKPAALEELRAAIKRGAQGLPGGVMIPDGRTLYELSDFGHLNERQPGKYNLAGLTDHDDHVMALAIAWQASKQAPRSLCYGSRGGDFFQRSIIEQMEQSEIDKTLRARAEAEAF